MRRPSTEDLVSIAHGVAGDECGDLLDQLSQNDLTASELVAMAMILRGAMERKQAYEREPADLKLVRARRRKRA